MHAPVVRNGFQVVRNLCGPLPAPETQHPDGARIASTVEGRAGGLTASLDVDTDVVPGEESAIEKPRFPGQIGADVYGLELQPRLESVLIEFLVVDALRALGVRFEPILADRICVTPSVIVVVEQALDDALLDVVQPIEHHVEQIGCAVEQLLQMRKLRWQWSINQEITGRGNRYLDHAPRRAIHLSVVPAEPFVPLQETETRMLERLDRHEFRGGETSGRGP